MIFIYRIFMLITVIAVLDLIEELMQIISVI